jgi:hypothetical protein
MFATFPTDNETFSRTAMLMPSLIPERRTLYVPSTAPRYSKQESKFALSSNDGLTAFRATSSREKALRADLFDEMKRIENYAKS